MLQCARNVMLAEDTLYFISVRLVGSHSPFMKWLLNYFDADMLMPRGRSHRHYRRILLSLIKAAKISCFMLFYVWVVETWYDMASYWGATFIDAMILFEIFMARPLRQKHELHYIFNAGSMPAIYVLFEPRWWVVYHFDDGMTPPMN